MSICQHCGTHFITSPLCTTCRPVTAIPLEYAVPQKLPHVWRDKFAAIDRAGGVELPKLNLLPLMTRVRLRCNVFAMLFGVVYYICKGMLKRGIALTALLVAVTLLLLWLADQLNVPADVAHNVTAAISATVYAWRANLDYYKLAVLGDDSWW